MNKRFIIRTTPRLVQPHHMNLLDSDVIIFAQTGRIPPVSIPR